jgi:ankyrin repeat protein
MSNNVCYSTAPTSPVQADTHLQGTKCKRNLTWLFSPPRCASGDRGTPLHAASRWRNIDAVSLLLVYGADANVTNEDGHTPLCTAYDSGHLEIMLPLLEDGPAAADVQSCVVGLLLTNLASTNGEAEVMCLLLKHNANVYARRAPGPLNYPPMHWASRCGHADIVQILLERGAEMDAISYVGSVRREPEAASLCKL